MAGIADLVSAFAGGDRIEDAAYAQHGKRILDAQNSAAMLDKRVQEAIAAANQNRTAQNFENTFTPDLSHPDALKYAIMSGFGGDLNSSMQAVGQQGENEILQMIMGLIQEQQKSGAPPADLMNMMVSGRDGRLLGPGNVRVDDQADADIGKTLADTLASVALAGDRNATRDKTLSEMVTDAQGNPVVVPETETVDAFSRDTLWANPEQLAVTLGSKWWGDGPERVEMLPFDDPRAQAAWADKTPEERRDMLQFLGPEFTMWREANIANDPSLKDTGIAIGRFLRERDIQSANPPQQQVVAEAEQNAANAQQAKAQFQTPQELGAAIAAGTVRPGDVVMTPEGPRVVKMPQ